VTEPQSLMLLAQQLENTLQAEFEALQKNELDRFEALQPAKADLLAELSRLCPPAEQLQTDPQWASLHELLSRSRDGHRRNGLLITRKLEAIRGALASLETEQPGSSVEVYDRLGQMARYGRGRGYQDA
jgi:flagellar biosynthesis/type III secretory pathway chaperone